MNFPVNPTDPEEPPAASLPPAPAVQARRRNLLASFVLILAGIAAGTPALRAEVYGRVGFLLSLVAFLEIAHGFRRSTAAGQRAAWIDGAISLAMGLALVNSSVLAASALKIVLAGWCGLDGVRRLVAAFRAGMWRKEVSWALPAFGNLALAALLLGLDGRPLAWLVALTAAFRMADAGARIFRSPAFTADDSAETIIETYDLPGRPELEKLARRIATEETERAAIDRGWIVGFIATLFAIHFGRIGIDRSFLGVLSPFVAVLGDLAIALLLAFFVVIPSGMGWRRLSRPLASRAWAWTLAGDPESRGLARRVLHVFLSRRLRVVIRLRQARYSFRVALSRGLQTGLPLAAILAATVPVWGMSWYFDTEMWAAGVWNSWAEERTDDWRAVMVAAVRKDESKTPPDRALAVHPPGVEGD
ncbi:MAG TPA: hypothetical protein VNC50_10175, partial [Planctomycetia bacterium]|nr:hypothetical protein [Planctomycetia bacterium]